MRHDVQHRLVHDAAQPEGRTEVIGKHKKRRDVGPETAERHAIADRGHDVFANSKVEILSAVIRGAEMSGLRIVIVRFV